MKKSKISDTLFIPLKLKIRQRKNQNLWGLPQDIIEAKIGLNQQDMKNENDEPEVNSYPKKKIREKVEQPKIVLECPNCKQRCWVEFEKG